MKIIYIDYQGVIKACTEELPQFHPHACEDMPGVHDCPMCSGYDQALQACKNSAVPFEDWKRVRVMLGDKPIMMDTFYQIDADWEIVTVMSEGWQPSYNNPDNYGCEQPAEPIQVARLKVPAPTVATDNSGELKEKIEFIKACFQIYVGHDTTKQLEQFLKFSKFEITRKS